MMGSRVFGEAGDKVVVEEFLTGIEASMLCFVDGQAILPMASAQDYKRICDGDQGPNTGGMGTYSPSLVFDPGLEERIRREILAPTLAGFQADGLDFRGVLFIGLLHRVDELLAGELHIQHLIRNLPLGAEPLRDIQAIRR